ncbi:hypothetical protein P3X46_027349 [Hevea brasiliensis]|uniref:Leucine-rich repeat-containing N-terminal plant-type domain-containing protein n=1 Tax=Hevea brasiliensis TaxID=3981 RepID=A0ABQ9L2K8_HEVBR|nr:receptor-like protein 46 [Hevea brasiliensis]KAJ9153967.1 hypothetical protein P3X46_027349 [Hevea brasiliensis]
MAKINPLLFAIFIIILIPNISLSCPQHQKEALLQFKILALRYLSSHIDFFKPFDTWNNNFHADCCQWSGVACSFITASKQVVTGLNLNSFISGSISEYATCSLDSHSQNIVLSSHVLTPLFHVRTLEFFFISCNNIQGEISGIGLSNLTALVELDMSHNMFNGSIPPQLFSLRHLKSLSLDFNFFHGEIPVEIGNLTNLQELSLSNNKLAGAIPPALCRLKKLQVLHLQYNLFSMAIPAVIGNLSDISTMLLNDNHLAGEIPLTMQKMGQLMQLNLENNLLSGEIPAWMFHFRNLGELKLGGSQFVWKNTSIVPKSMLSVLSLRSCGASGLLPLWLSNQTSLSYLDLSVNNLVGNLPSWLTKLKLTHLILSDNKFSGSLPPILFQSKLKNIDLSRNNFSGNLPDNIPYTISLEILKLSSNDFSGPIPISISEALFLRFLDLSKNRFSGNKFPSFEKLLFVDLSSNKLSGGIPLTFSPLVVTLVLSHNQFSGVLPQYLKDLYKLQCLDLHDNNITGNIPAFLFQISSLRILNLRNNSLEGSIPNNLSNATLLQILDLSNNKLSGKVPSSLGNLSAVIHNSDGSFFNFFSPKCDVNYRLPDPLFKLLHQSWTSKQFDSFYDSWLCTSLIISVEYPNLEVIWKTSKRDLPQHHLDMYTLLDLSMNQLSGEIPHTLGGLKSLKVLNMSYNKISGKIPATLGDVDSLESLDLSHNNLSGEIPNTFGKLLQLAVLELNNNKLTGHIPNGPQMDTLNDPNFYANNSGLCGMQIKVPCDPEAPPKAKPAEKSESKEAWFSWEMAAIGFPSGFLSTVISLYVIGYFSVAPRRPGRRHV